MKFLEILFKKEFMLTKDQFIDAIKRSNIFNSIESNFHTEITNSSAEFQTFKNELQEEAWLDYNKLLDLLDGKIDDFMQTMTDFDSEYCKRRRLPGELIITHDVYSYYLETRFGNLNSSIINLPQIGVSFTFPNNRFWNESDALNVYGTPLTIAISNTQVASAIQLIDAGADVNKYAYDFGNNPLLLAITKGWKHICDEKVGERVQEEIIEKLLHCNELLVDKRHLFNGMTALHIACLRGDEPELIQKLLERGSDPAITDYEGKTAMEYLDLEYRTVINIFNKLINPTDIQWFTIPTEMERTNNVEQLHNLFIDSRRLTPY